MLRYLLNVTVRGHHVPRIMAGGDRRNVAYLPLLRQTDGAINIKTGPTSCAPPLGVAAWRQTRCTLPAARTHYALKKAWRVAIMVPAAKTRKKERRKKHVQRLGSSLRRTWRGIGWALMATSTEKQRIM
jgi:hypothetical protein